MLNNFNKNHLNHNIYIVDILNSWTDGICEKCKMKVYYYKLSDLYLVKPEFDAVHKMYLTCEEQQIKNILE